MCLSAQTCNREINTIERVVDEVDDDNDGRSGRSSDSDDITEKRGCMCVNV